MKKNETDIFNANFPDHFNAWFDSRYPESLWSSAKSHWRIMKQAAFAAYQYGQETKGTLE